MAFQYAPVDTPIGELWVTVSPGGLVAISRRPNDVAADIDPDAVAGIARQLRDYFAGRRRGFAITLDLRGASAFDAEVWTAAREIPYGATVSYGELAALVGRPGAARAVGGAMARCPYFPVVPCHRVIRADGSLGGWGGEAWVKRWLLELESGGAPPRYYSR